MAKNLRAKLPSTDKLYVYDVNTTSTARFSKECDKHVEVASSAREAAERSVSCASYMPFKASIPTTSSQFHDELLFPFV